MNSPSLSARLVCGTRLIDQQERILAMTEITRKAGVIWNGDSRSGGGLISTESKVLYEQPYTYATRFEDTPGTNPEELIAAAHAACYSMAFASTLKKNDFTAKEIETNAECTIESVNGGHEITHMLLHVRAQIPNIDDATFQKLAAEADKGCPVSKLLRHGLKIDLKADLI
jgi:lipoyl-dependent peroxiredoxin